MLIHKFNPLSKNIEENDLEKNIFKGWKILPKREEKLKNFLKTEALHKNFEFYVSLDHHAIANSFLRSMIASAIISEPFFFKK